MSSGTLDFSKGLPPGLLPELSNFNRLTDHLDITESKVDYVAPSFGGGINIKLGESVMLNLQETFLYSTSDLRDGLAGNSNDMYLFHTAGFTFNFGKNNDAVMAYPTTR